MSKQFQEQLILERTSSTAPAETQNTYQPGDFVLFERNKSVPRPNKLSSDFLGPFEVISQTKNDVTTRNLVYGNVREYHVEAIDLASATLTSTMQTRLFHTEGIQILAGLWNFMSSLNLVIQFGCLTLRTFFR